ncbi:MAG: serine/threonine-protein phosphatase, partial [Acidaminococcaceae bacterium]|nr:serine/threonine-protein phosphatase [Acidaminococcaceae bacterium]
MTEFIKQLPNIILGVFLICFLILYYLSVKKCFWRKDKGKGKLFLLTLAANPVLLWLVTTMAVAFTIGFFQKEVPVLPSMSISTVLYLVLIFACSHWIAKKLDVFNQSFVTFVSLMFSVIWSLAMRSDISAVENAPDYGPAFDAVINLLLLAACILLYRFVIVALSRLTDKRRRMNMRMFIIPPAAFSLFYNIFSAVMAFRGYEANENLYVNLFSVIILALFIWAFYVVITNINATNDALEANEKVAEMAKAEARIEADLAIAKEIQTSALPRVFPPFPERREFELFASMNAAKEVGGDFYDFFLLDDSTLGFVIADVSGKSIPGAMFMMTAKTVIKSLAESGLAPHGVFTQTNQKLCENNEAGMFVTAWLGYLDLKTGLVRVANAGHNPPVLIREGKADYVRLKAGFVLAGMEGIRYKEQTVQMQKGDLLYLYTD